MSQHLDSGGVMKWREHYTPFGEKLLDPTANKDRPGYTGHIQDDWSGLTYMQARYYDPVLGRFLQTDPIGYQDQLNLYAYVRNDPVNMVDPFGTSSFTVGGSKVSVSFLAPGDNREGGGAQKTPEPPSSDLESNGGGGKSDLDDFALNWLSEYNDKSIQESREYGVVVYQTSDSGFITSPVFRGPVCGGNDGSCQVEYRISRGLTPVALIHTHGPLLAESITSGEVYSVEDIRTTNAMAARYPETFVASYLGTPLRNAYALTPGIIPDDQGAYRTVIGLDGAREGINPAYKKAVRPLGKIP